MSAGATRRATPASSAATSTSTSHNRYWDFKSVGRGNINFEKIIRALNDIGYTGPLSVEWEDGAMDREFGATESCAFTKRLDFPPSDIVFDEQFSE